MSGLGLTGLVEVVVGLLLLASGALMLIASFGMLRLSNFFQRLHAAGLIPTLASWCVALASILYFSVTLRTPALYQLVVLVFLAITVPVPTLLLMRTALFRKRQARVPGLPPAFGLPDSVAEGAGGTPESDSQLPKK